MGETYVFTGDASGQGRASLEITRRFTAGPSQLFFAWTDAEGMRSWMCPGEATEARAKLDVWVGGHYRIDIVGPTGIHEHRGEYIVVDPPRRISFSWISAGTHYQRSVVTIDVRPVGGETELVLRHEGLPNAASANEHRAGWESILDKLDATLR